jgi:hypothetical protein
VKRLYAALSKIPRHSAPWAAIRAATSALQMQVNEIRRLLLWIALEALFGAEAKSNTDCPSDLHSSWQTTRIDP